MHEKWYTPTEAVLVVNAEIVHFQYRTISRIGWLPVRGVTEMDFDPVFLSRLQFAWVIGWHISAAGLHRRRRGIHCRS